MSILRFEWVELFNFKSYRGKHKFSFPTAPGLYSITGRNLVNPRLGANGIGKSTLLDAVFWACYGATPRGLRAGDVITYDEKTASVELCLSYSKEQHLIKRTQAPNSLKLDGEIISQDALIEFLGLTADQLTHSILYPQFGTAFFDLAPAAKLTLFSQIMGLDYWLEKSQKAGDEAGRLTGVINRKDQEISHQEGQYEALEAELPELERQRDEFEGKRKAAIAELRRELKGLDDPELPRILAGLKAKIGTITKKRKELSDKWQKTNVHKALAEAECAKTVQTLENIEGLEGQCPTCFQTVSTAHLSAEKKRLGAYLTKQKAAVRAALADSEGFKTSLRVFEGDAASLTKNLEDFTQKHTQNEARKRTINSLIEAESKRENHYSKLLGQKRGQLKALEASLVTSLDELDALKAQHAAFTFWVGGFKRIRLFIIDETLKQLEIEVNNDLASLGLPDWCIELDVERETKSGSISKGFVVMVYPPGVEKPVRLEAWSGGETQRLRLAGDLGLANLIMDRAGLDNTLEVFDEPSSHLSQEGLLDLLDTLQQRAADHNKVILVVDHHALDYSFDGVFTIVKDKNGSKLEG